jgi:hypothetical protein
MYVDLILLFLIYSFATIALAVSVYALWTLQEVKDEFKKKQSKPGNAWDHYHNKAKEKPKAKGYWN